MRSIEFEWDAAKQQLNLHKHRIDFEDAIAMFEAPMFVRRSDRDGEERWLGIGQVDGRVLVVIYALREDRYRLISARKARTHERQGFYDQKAAPGG